MKHKVLIVDDEPDLEQIINMKFRKRIKSGELEFTYAAHGQEALEKLQSNEDIDMVFSDINMPVMDGLTFLNNLKESEFQCKVVIVSAYGDIGNIRTAMNRGAFDFVIKPIDLTDFEITLDKTIKETDAVQQALENKLKLEEERKEKEELIINQNSILEKRVQQRTEELSAEKDKSDNLLLNILPLEVANELKELGISPAKHFEQATVIFTDFVGFTGISQKMKPAELVEEIHHCFTGFDAIVEKYNIEKIKTIGDAYMAAGGLPVPDNNSVKNTVLAAIEMQAYVANRKKENDAKGKPAFEMRAGVHSGPIVAGIVGVKKFQYDIWGDTVNTASRIESCGAANKVNISKSTYELLKNDPQFSFEYRGEIEAKGKGPMEMWFVSLSAK